MNEYLAKPIARTQLSAALYHVIKQPAAAAGAEWAADEPQPSFARIETN